MFPGVGYQELLVFGIIALVLYGKDLPNVAKKFGKSYSEFRKGMQGLQREFTSAMDDSPAPSYRSTPATPSKRPDPLETRPEEFRAPRFEPPVAPPTAKS